MGWSASLSIWAKTYPHDAPCSNQQLSPRYVGDCQLLFDKMIPTLELSNALLREMITYVDQHAPYEACGLLAGKMDRAEKMIGVLNQAQSPVRFVMDPYEQLHA